jgi:transcriptional regulator with XRE-family HTH domain
MRRLTLGMRQREVGEALGLSFQQVNKYEKGTDRIGASRLKHIAEILQVPAAFFFEQVADRPQLHSKNATASPSLVTALMATAEGLALAKAFMRISDKQMRRRIIDLVEEIVGGQLH